MSYEEKQRESEEVETALRHFRESVRGWSDNQFTGARTIVPSRRGFWARMAQAQILGWGMAAVLAISAVTVPYEMHHQRQLAEQSEAAQLLKDKAAHAAQLQAAASAISDEELLSHVDSDLAQATPDAMEPLARLMSEASSQSSNR